MDTSTWKTVNINTIFDISYGNKLDMCQMTPDVNGIPFVTRTAANNGVGGVVEYVEGVTPYPAGSLSIALGGSIGSTFLQTKDFYTSQNVAVLQPKYAISYGILLFLAKLIEKECSMRFVAFGRELNKHIKRDFTIKLPMLEDGTPDWQFIENFINDTIIPQLPKKAQKIWLKKYDIRPLQAMKMQLNTKDWKWFRYDEIFNIKKGKRLTKEDMTEGTIRYIGAIDSNNGLSAFIGNDTHVHKGNTITVSYNGSIGYAFYQDKDFWATDDVNVLYPKFVLNRYIAHFLCTIVEQERYRFCYGRKWDLEMMNNSRIKLPVTPEGTPDWQFMEDYIKSLPYSKNIEPSDPKEMVDELMEVKKEMIKLRHELQKRNTSELQIIGGNVTYNDYSTNYNVKK